MNWRAGQEWRTLEVSTPCDSSFQRYNVKVNDNGLRLPVSIMAYQLIVFLVNQIHIIMLLIDGSSL